MSQEKQEHGLAVGTGAPPFALPATDGRARSLAELTERGPVLLVFYRGWW